MTGFGRYNLLFKLGQGGMGVLYLARQKTLKRYCVLKVIHPHLSKDKNCAERFLHEARSAASLSHTNLVSIFDCDQFEGEYFIAMEFIEGLTLLEVVQSCGPLPLPLAFYLLNQAAIGLEYLHNQNVIHRDIKPENMMVDARGTLKIMDLGLAKQHFEDDQTMTVTGMILGSPHYMSPEQIQDSKTVDYRTDLYSLGIVLYQILVGKLPFHQTSAAGLLMAHLNKTIPSVSEARPDITQPVDALIARLTAKKREERFQSATELIAELQPWLVKNPFDEAAELIWSGLDFKSRAVEQLLLKEKIDVKKVDSEISGVVQPHRPKSRSWTAALLILLLLIASSILFFEFGSRSKLRETLSLSHSSSSDTRVKEGGILGNQVGGLVVTTQPKGASIMFQNRVEVSPASFERVAVGEYMVKVSFHGYKNFEQRVQIVEGKSVELNVVLARLLGSATIKSVPAGADVFVKDKRFGRTPLTLQGGEGETMECFLRLDGYEEKALRVSLSEKGGEYSKTLVPLKQNLSAKKQKTGAGSRPVPHPSPVLPNEQLTQQVMPALLVSMLDEEEKEKLLKNVESGGNLEEILRRAMDHDLDPQQQARLIEMRQQALEMIARGLGPDKIIEKTLAQEKLSPEERHDVEETANQLIDTYDRQTIQHMFKTLRVSGVSTLGKVATATINNQVVEQGKTCFFKYGGRTIEYKVIRIENDKITLRHGDIEEAIPVSNIDLENFMEH